MLGVLLNSSFGTNVTPNVTKPCAKEATTIHIESSVGAGDGRRFSRRLLRGGDFLPESFIMMPMMYATRDILEGEQLIWDYPWRLFQVDVGLQFSRRTQVPLVAR